MAGAVEPRVVGLGAAVQVAVVVPAAVVVSALRPDDIGAESNLWLVAAFLVLAAGPAAAGVLVGRRCPDSPLLHAAAATALAWALLAAVSSIRAAAAGAEVTPLLATLLTIAPIQVGIGVLSAFFTRPRSQPDGDPTMSAHEPAITFDERRETP